MKKVSICSILMVLIIVCTFCLAGCQEYRLRIDKELQPTFIDDNYRTYYEIFVGAFSDSNDDGMGDLQGIINRLNYLNDGNPNSGKSLKITGIWLMPIMPSPSYHKYDVTDYMAIDEQYGSMDTMRKLVDECHKRGINVIIDLVLNHTSVQHEWFKQAKKARAEGDVNNKYYDYYSVKIGTPSGGWYDFATDPDGNNWIYEGNFSSEMPELNYDNPKVKEEVANICKFWLSDVGIDGFRLDAVKYFYYGDNAKNVELLKWLNETCQSYKSDAYLVGENWDTESSIVYYYEAINCFDFSFAEQNGIIVTSAKNNGGDWFSENVVSYCNQIKSSNANAIMTPFISNHDMDRSAGYLYADDKTLQLAASLYLLMPGNPFIYYGEEIGMKGSRGSDNTDANRRLAMLWGDGDSVQNPEGSTYDSSRQTNGTVKSQLKDENSIYNHYKKLIALRNANPEIARGVVTAVYGLGDNLSVLRYEYNNSVVYVVHNFSNTTVTVDVSSLNVTTLRGWATSQSTLKGNSLQLGACGSVVLK